MLKLHQVRNSTSAVDVNKMIQNINFQSNSKTQWDSGGVEIVNRDRF